MRKLAIFFILGFWSTVTLAETNTEVSKDEIDSSLRDMNSALGQARALPPGSNGMVVLPSKRKNAKSAPIYQNLEIQSDDVQTARNINPQENRDRTQTETETTNSN